MKYDIRVWPDPVLREPTQAVEVFDDELRELLDDMTVIMHEADGVGLAAPQIGLSKKIAVVYDGEHDRIYHLINPEVVATKGKQDGEEGCLSFPGLYGKVRRPMNVTVRYRNAQGDVCELEASGFLARAFCHEIDHLNGRLFVDNFSVLKREMVLKKMGQS